MTPATVPFNRLLPMGDELRHLEHAIRSGHVSGAGPYTRRCEDELSAITGAHRTLLTTSCTHALELAMHLLDLQPGDEVIVPSFTFVSTAAAVALRGAVPVFADIRPDTLGLDERLLDDLVTDRTRAVVVVHYAGVACEMDALSAWAERHDVVLVEDNAHGLFGSYRERALGSFGALSTLSFHETKNVSCGEGGALQINRPDLVGRAEILREKGTNRSAFFRGEVDKYSWVDLGSSWVASDMLAAFLWGQLECAEEIQRRRRRIWDAYADELADWAAHTGFRLPHVPPDREQPSHLFALLAPSAEVAAGLRDHLREQGVHAVFHYVPLHESPAGRRFGRAPLPLPVTEETSAVLNRLPLWPLLPDADLERVIAAVRSFGVT
jgi:dTDP-4-amino-4,6-dideoxygalactose transaminase